MDDILQVKVKKEKCSRINIRAFRHQTVLDEQKKGDVQGKRIQEFQRPHVPTTSGYQTKLSLCLVLPCLTFCIDKTPEKKKDIS